MNAAGLSGNLMSLGAIDFGLIVDGAVIIVENAVRRLARGARAARGATLDRERAPRGGRGRRPSRCARASVFGEAIIAIVYLPILALHGHRGEAVPADGARPCCSRSRARSSCR